MTLWNKIAQMDRYRKRGMIYIIISIIGIVIELFFSKGIDYGVLILWLGVSGIGIIVMLTLKDPHRKR